MNGSPSGPAWLCRGGSQSLTIPGTVRKGATIVLRDMRTLQQMVAPLVPGAQAQLESGLGDEHADPSGAGDERRSKEARMELGRTAIARRATRL